MIVDRDGDVRARVEGDKVDVAHVLADIIADEFSADWSTDESTR